MTSTIAAAIAGMDPQQQIEYLTNLKYKAGEPVPQAVPPSSPDYGTWYNDRRDQGVGYDPGTWSEVEHLWITGVISDPVYDKALTAFLSGGKPAAPEQDAPADKGDGEGEADAPAATDGGPAEGKRLSFSR